MDIYAEIAEKREAGETFVLATMVRTAGSSPREVGAKMLVCPDGSTSGTIGGGDFEKTVIDDCLTLFKGDSSHLLKTYGLSPTGPGATGVSCGGEADVFMELFARPERLLVFGGGHVAKELVGIARKLDFRITVVDDRQDVLNQYEKPVETILTNSGYEDNLPSLDESCYVVMVTRSHACDRTVLARVINEDVAYLGMIGSKTKIAETFSFLKASGIDESLLGKVHTPIGLDIGAEGPGEIAISIAAELVATRRKASTGKTSHHLRAKP